MLASIRYLPIEQFNEFVDIAFGKASRWLLGVKRQKPIWFALWLNSDYTETIEGAFALHSLISTTVKKSAFEQVADVVSISGPSSISREKMCNENCNSSKRKAGFYLRSKSEEIQLTVAETVEPFEGYRIEYHMVVWKRKQMLRKH